jgi:hypothetical protein
MPAFSAAWNSTLHVPGLLALSTLALIEHDLDALLYIITSPKFDDFGSDLLTPTLRDFGSAPIFWAPGVRMNGKLPDAAAVVVFPAVA